MADISKIKMPGVNTAYNIKDVSARTVQYTSTLSASGWTGSGPYAYTLSLTSLQCGSNGAISPIIFPTSNRDEYSLIESADATPKVGITFSTSVKPSANIGIIVQDTH